MREALIAGVADPKGLAERACQRLREKIPALPWALPGRVTAPHRFLLRLPLDPVTHLEERIGRRSARASSAELGPDFLNRLEPERLTRQLVERLLTSLRLYDSGRPAWRQFFPRQAADRPVTIIPF